MFEKYFTTKLLLITVFFMGMLAPVSVFAAAECPKPASDWKVVGDVCVPSSTRTGMSDIKIYSSVADENSLLVNVVLWLAGILGVLTVLVIIVAGIMYLTSGGDEDRANTAKKTLTYAIIGLAIALLAWVIVKAISTTLGIA